MFSFHVNDKNSVPKVIVPRVPEWKRKREKLLRNSGQPYVNRRGKPILGKEMRPSCTESCRLKCYETLTDDQLLNLFHEYYALANVESQWQYLSNHIDTSVPKTGRRYNVRNKEAPEFVEPKRNRTNNICYYLDVNHERVRVCRETFLATYDIGPQRIKTVIKKTNKEGVLVVGDKRGFRKLKTSGTNNTNK